MREGHPYQVLGGGRAMKRTALPLPGRREFITLLGGGATWPLAARAKQAEQVRRIGLLMAGDENDPVRGTKGWLSTFTRGLVELGWIDGRNLRIDVRWDGDNVDRNARTPKS